MNVNEEIKLAGEQAAYQERNIAAKHRRYEISFRNKAMEDKKERRLKIEKQRASKYFDSIYILFLTVYLGIDRSKLLDKLSSHDYWGALRRIRKQRHGKTSSWLSESKIFTDWLNDTQSGTLWLSGIRKIFLGSIFE